MESVDEFLIAERTYCDDESRLSVGLANIRAEVPDIEANKDKILRAASIFKERGRERRDLPGVQPVGLLLGRARRLPGLHGEGLHGQPHRLAGLRAEAHARRLLSGHRAEQPPQGLGRALLQHHLRRRGRSGVPAPENSYDKVFLPGVEKDYTESGRDDRLVVETEFGSFGFTTCYDYLFAELLREYSAVDHVDAIVQIASWRAAANRDYPGMNVRTDHYYGDLWDFVMPASSATNQFWTIACNAVGRHGVSGAPFWGGSGVWAPSGLCLVQASRFNEELVIVHNLDIEGARAAEKDDFDYAFDFKEIFRPLEGSRTFTRHLT